MLELYFDITVGNFRTNRVADVRINSAWRTLGDTAIIKLPNLKGTLARGINQIKAGDAVTIKLGYDGVLNTVFEGFVKFVNPNIPMEIECEDFIYKLRGLMLQNKHTPTINDCLNLINEGLKKQDIPEISFDTALGEIQAGNLRLDYSAASLLKKFQDEFGFACFFIGRKLYIGFPTQTHIGDKKFFRLRYDGPGDVISSNLKFMVADQVKIKIKAVGVLIKGRRIINAEENIGDPEGEIRTVYYPDVSDRKQINDMARADLQKLRYDGYYGGFTTFGKPWVKHGDLIAFQDDLFPERAGTYYCDEVITTSGHNGFRQEIKLGLKMDL